MESSIADRYAYYNTDRRGPWGASSVMAVAVGGGRLRTAAMTHDGDW